MRGIIGRYAWRLHRRWPWLRISKIPPMTRVRWWLPEVININRKERKNGRK